MNYSFLDGIAQLRSSNFVLNWHGESHETSIFLRAAHGNGNYMIMLHCPNCGFSITPSMMVKDDVQSCIATCAQKDCGAIYRITIVCLHEGKPIPSDVKHKYLQRHHQQEQTSAK